jgi:hypothetical protein
MIIATRLVIIKYNLSGTRSQVSLKRKQGQSIHINWLNALLWV